ncbi:hypothetical protein ACF0H5_007002 [Mactra antiquata]
MENLCFNCVFLLLAGFCAGIDLDADLNFLSELLPGFYSNNARHTKNFRHTFDRPSGDVSPAEALTTIPVSSIYQPVEVTFLSEAFNVYVEQTQYDKQKKQWLYSFSKDDTKRSIRLKVYSFLDNSLTDKISKNPRSIKYLTARDVNTRSECDMLWRRLREQFIGTTTRRCVAVVDHVQVRISVMMTLSKSSLQIDEGWYRVDNGSRILELQEPVNMTKISNISEESQNQDLTQSADIRPKSKKHEGVQMDQRRHNSKSRDLPSKPYFVPYPQHDSRSWKGEKVSYPTNDIEPLYTNAIEKAGFSPYERIDTRNRKVRVQPTNVQEEQKATWNIQTFDAVIDALTNGHKVYFTAHTKNCLYDYAPRRDRTTFGDYVEVFEIHKDMTGKHTYQHLRFSIRRMQHVKRKGIRESIKEITVHRNNTVHILSVLLDEDGRINKHSRAVCNLYNQDKEEGDVKFYLDPYRNVVKINKVRILRTSLQEGKMVRITTELEKCSGGKSDLVIIGGELRGYDLGRNGKTVEVTLTRRQVLPVGDNDLTVEENFTAYKFSKHGDITVTRHSKHVTSLLKNVSIVSGYQRYKCDIDPNSSTKAVFLFNS